MFKGDPLENIGSFRPRIESWFQDTIRITSTSPPTDNELNSQSKCKYLERERERERE